MLIFSSFLGLFLGLVFSIVTLLSTRRYFNKQLTEALQRELLKSVHQNPLPEALKETTRHCMNQAVIRFREKMPMIGGFITPTMIDSMEELMLEQLQNNWPSLVENITPTLMGPLVKQGLYNPSLIKLWMGYSALLGWVMGLIFGCIGLVSLITR